MNLTEDEVREIVRKALTAPETVSLFIREGLCGAALRSCDGNGRLVLGNVLLCDGEDVNIDASSAATNLEWAERAILQEICKRDSWWQFLHPGEEGYDWWADRIKACATKARLKGVKDMEFPVSILS